ncbi:hypothetical protein SAY87_016409 [Trapa incisa]|uniref:Lipase-like PAD4 n=1 Tax=Trapa incisa TaxID=236973 RepID=A0AAN7QZ19_9MYRT|nr:hypothetical protein SAY87_016409 [Trapa incisa]
MDGYEDCISDQFETSEMLASFLASTPILSDAWRLCSHANAAAPGGFVTEVAGGVGYLAFSAVQEAGSAYGTTKGSMVRLDAVGNGLFSALNIQGKDDEATEEMPAMVHAGFLQLFMGFRENANFQNQMSILLESGSNCRSIVITGHSIGAALAALTSLWLLCHFPSIQVPVLCITFGSPLIGNAPLSRAILRQRWGGSFCHVVSKYDILPRLLFATPSAGLPFLLHVCHSGSIPDQGLFSLVLSSTEKAAEAIDQQLEGDGSCFTPFGTYLFCCEEGGICLDNGASVVKMMHLLFSRSSPRQTAEDHFRYGEYIRRLCFQFLKRGLQGRQEDAMLNESSSYNVGVSLALQSSGIDADEMVSGPVIDCLAAARQSGCTRNLNVTQLAIRLSKISPNKAQIEWYKSTCEASPERLGYYDTFKQMRTTKREHAVNMSRVSLAAFWNGVIAMWERNELPHDFDRMAKWIYAANSYRLLVEPLDIADYYRTEQHLERGHYMEGGRERRYRIFEQWLKEKEARKRRSRRRSGFAALTQDSCFWARVEEAKQWSEAARSGQGDPAKLRPVLERIYEFERHATGLIDNREVSVDVLAENSSYSKWLQEWTALKPWFQKLNGYS